MDRASRDLRFDNLKGIMILLVVFCHFIELFVPNWPQQGLLRALYCCIYSFHMPVFIFCSGYFSKRSGTDKNCVKLALRDCLLPYLAFQVIYGLLTFQQAKSPTESLLAIFSFAEPRWAMWYLLSLFFWRTFVHPFTSLRWPLAFSIVLSIYIGTTNAGSFFSISRSFAFFPYFLCGFLLSSYQLERLRATKYSVAAIGFTAAMGCMILFAREGFEIGFLRMNKSYIACSWIVWRAMLMRLFLLGVGFLCIASLAIWIPDKKTPFTIFGTYSLPIFLLHPAALTVLGKTGWAINNPWAAVGSALCVSLSLCFLFGNRYIHTICRSLLRFLGRMMLRDDPSE